MIEKIKSGIRPILSLIFAIGLTAGFAKGVIPAEAYIGVASMSIAFWFRARDEEKRR